LVSPERRGTAYGLLNSGYGLAWFLGSVLLGVLYDISLPALIIFSMAAQLAAVPLLWRVGKHNWT
jgi:predicted MFS family arabinose efflux permease